MSETPQPHPSDNLPSGYLAAEQLPEHLTVDTELLPWLREPHELTVAKCDIDGGTSFYLASVVGSHRRLIAAAEGMTDDQKQITDNMFYSRIAGFVQNGHAPNVDTLPKPATDFPIHVMRNKGGQRAYFGIPLLPLKPGEQPVPVVLRLGVCDKNKQGEVMKVLTDASKREQMRKKSK
jgi:hypothetical protein